MQICTIGMCRQIVLEEIKIQYSELFIKNGGKELVYIPCLNSGKDHVNMIGNLIKENIKGW